MAIDFHSDLWGGKKELLISTRTVMGGKNSFLGIAYVVVAGACVLLGTIFTITNLIKPRYVLLAYGIVSNLVPADSLSGAWATTAT